MKILFLIRSLEIGGAERQLVILANGFHQRGHEVSVVVFYADGSLEKELHEMSIPIFDLRKFGRWDVLTFFLRLVKVVEKQKPSVIYGFLGAPNILTAFLKPIFPKIRMIWGVRASNVDFNRYDWLARASYQIECWLSKFADLIICNSRAGLEYAAAHGFPSGKLAVIPNGIDSERFKPDAVARARVREEWGVTKDEILIGLIARLDPMKDHPTFLRAALMLARERADVRFVCVGDGPEAYKDGLHRLAIELGLDGKLIWAGVRRDMPAVFNALDIASSCSSYGEGFSNAIAEAMACGLPCVVTDVGDSASIVENTGIVVQPNSPMQLSNAWKNLLEADRLRIMGLRARNRAQSLFNVQRMVSSTESILNSRVTSRVYRNDIQ